MVNMMFASVDDNVSTAVDDYSGDDYSAFHPQPYQVAAVIFVIITFLVVVTIVFEIIKDFAIENSDKYTKPITVNLFSEMAVMGFLSVSAFAITYSGALEILSEDSFGLSAPMFITFKLLEVQYCLFLVLILIVLQVFALVYIGNLYSEKFREYNEISQDKGKMARYIDEIDLIPNVTYLSWTCDYLVDPVGAWRMHDHRVEVEEVVLFYSLRAETLLRRSPLPPYKPERKDRQLPANFDFATYLSLSLSGFLTKVVTLTPLAWLAALVFAAAFYGALIAMDGDYVMVTVMWICIGYLSFFLMLILEYQTNSSFEHLMNPGHLQICMDDDKTASSNDDSQSQLLAPLSDGVNVHGAVLDVDSLEASVSISLSHAQNSRDFDNVDFQSDFVVTPTEIGNFAPSRSHGHVDDDECKSHIPAAASKRPSYSNRSESMLSVASKPESEVSFGVRPESVASFGVRPEGEGSLGIRTVSEASFGVGPPSVFGSEVSFGIGPLSVVGSEVSFGVGPPSVMNSEVSFDIRPSSETGFTSKSGAVNDIAPMTGRTTAHARGKEDASPFRLDEYDGHVDSPAAANSSGIPPKSFVSYVNDVFPFCCWNNNENGQIANNKKHFLQRTKGKDLHQDGEARPSMFPDWTLQLEELTNGDAKKSDWDVWRWIDPVPSTVQERLFMGGKHGPALNIFFVRTYIMLQSLYISMLLVFFIPYVYEEYGPLWGTVFLIVALLPLLLQYMTFYSRMVIQMVMMASSGCLLDVGRHKDVIRFQKLQKVVQMMIMLTKIKNAQAKVHRGKELEAGGQATVIDPKLQEEMDEVGRIFGKYDTSGDGELDIDELRPFVQSMGMSVDEVSLHRLFVILDTDDTGSISKAELLDWRMTKYYESTPEEEMKKIYTLFLEEGQTEKDDISITHLREVFESFNEEPFNANLSEKEIEEIVQEFDEDQSGWISFEEFSAILKDASKME